MITFKKKNLPPIFFFMATQFFLKKCFIQGSGPTCVTHKPYNIVKNKSVVEVVTRIKNKVWFGKDVQDLYAVK